MTELQPLELQALKSHKERQQPHNTGGGDNSERIQQLEQMVKYNEHMLKKTRREMLDLTIKDTRAVSYADYYKEKESEGRILSWVPEMQGSFLPAALQNPNRGSELHVVKPFLGASP